SPNDNINHNKSPTSLEIKTENEIWGKILGRGQIHHDNERYYYKYTQHFNIINDYPVWNWVNSAPFSKEKKTIASLPQKYQILLESAYREFWALLNSKDLSTLKKLHTEMLEESVRANGGTVESYFSSLGLKNTINDEKLELLPLNFNETEIEITLDGRVVYMNPTPIRYLNKEKNTTRFISPKFRFDGEKFIVTR
ncbi:hypothetical protein PSI22_18085, partial [Xenorhabdus sp. XENO-7]|nr:hypothetical protein [Xenorhabdus aichiensis]